MATSTRLSLLEYLKTDYQPDREYVDGELLERNEGKWEHARLQALLTSWLQSQEKSWSVKVATESRLQVSATRGRIPDVMLCVVRTTTRRHREPAGAGRRDPFAE